MYQNVYVRKITGNFAGLGAEKDTREEALFARLSSRNSVYAAIGIVGPKKDRSNG